MVIGAGQAGLSAAHHLLRRGVRPWPQPSGTDSGTRTVIVLDANPAPGGAWQHRWPSLRMDTVNGIHDLPDMAVPEFSPDEPAAVAVSRYFARYEAAQSLPILRPVAVRSVRREDADPRGRLVVASSAGTWRARAVLNATGSWTRPFWPSYPGAREFRGRQLHVADYRAATEFAGLHVAVVGGGISAVQLLDEISQVTSTTWFTRREPVWSAPGTAFDGRASVARVEERVRAGLPPQSVVAATGLHWSPRLLAAADRGVLQRQPMFTAIEPTGVRLADGGFQPVDVILWATGFRAALDHLAPLGLRGPGGGIAVAGTTVVAEPRVHLVGYGPAASTIGANRAGRDAAIALLRRLDEPGVDIAASPPPASVGVRAGMHVG